MELRHLEAFVAVADELHFGRAAERLHLAQSPVSQRILRLERELGVELFERTNRRVALSAAGSLLLPAARDVLDRTAAMRRLANGAAAGQAGVIRLGYVASAAFEILPAMLRAFRADAPDVAVELHRVRTSAQIEALQAGTLDAGIARAIDADANLGVLRLQRDPLVIALPDEHAMSAGGEIDLARLSTADWVLAAGPGQLTEQTIQACQRAGFTPHRAREAPDQPSILGLVAGGLGVALVPASVAAMKPAHVAVRELRDPEATLELNLIWRSAHPAPVLKRFLDAARTRAQAT